MLTGITNKKTLCFQKSIASLISEKIYRQGYLQEYHLISSCDFTKVTGVAKHSQWNETFFLLN